MVSHHHWASSVRPRRPPVGHGWSEQTWVLVARWTTFPLNRRSLSNIKRKLLFICSWRRFRWWKSQKKIWLGISGLLFVVFFSVCFSGSLVFFWYCTLFLTSYWPPVQLNDACTVVTSSSKFTWTCMQHTFSFTAVFSLSSQMFLLNSFKGVQDLSWMLLYGLLSLTASSPHIFAPFYKATGRRRKKRRKESFAYLPLIHWVKSNPQNCILGLAYKTQLSPRSI